MRALVLSTLPREGPSARPRLYAYERHLRTRGIEPVFAPLLSSRATRRFYALGPAARAARLAAAATGALSRLGRLLGAGGFDVVVVHRDLLPRGNRMALRLLERAKVPWVFDFDDAIYLAPRDYVDAGEPSRERMALGKDPSEIEAIVAGAAIVLAGNETIAAWARARCRDVRVQPTPVDTDVFRPPLRPEALGAAGVVGWVGSPTAAYCIRSLRAALGRLGHRRRYSLHVVGAGEPIDVPGVKCVERAWTLDDEPDEYRALTVGLYPLPDNDWTRGKCGYKALAYMASGAVPVVSPVGVNAEIVEHGVRGFHATSDDEWVEHVDRLLGDAELRAEMSVRGRAFVEAKFSVRALQEPFAAALLDAAARRP
jgi:glycosyltransferase involved in cell wall biosynthesis